MKRRPKNFIEILECLLLALLLLLAACGSDDKDKTTGGSSEETKGIAITDKEVAGVSQKGPFLNGSSVHLYELQDAGLIQTGKSFTGKIKSDLGEFSLAEINLVSQYALLEADGYYRNEVSGQKSTSQITLNAVTDLENRETVNINLLTHLAYDRMRVLVKGGMEVAAAKRMAEKEIFASFYIENIAENFEDLNIFNKGEGDAALLAVSVLMQGNRAEAELSELLANYANDVESDGEWNDEKTKVAMADWAEGQSLSEGLTHIRENVEGWDFGDVPGFEKYVKRFWWYNYGLDLCTTERQGEVKKNQNGLSENASVHYICDTKEWRRATDFEKDTYKWADGRDGEIKKGDVTENIYVFDKTKWRTTSFAEQTFGGCTESIADSIGKIDSVYYICKAGSWDTATVAQYDTYRYDDAIEGDVRNGRINPKFVYVFDGSEWRRGTRLDSVLYKNGGLACTGKKNTADGKIAVAGDTSAVKLKELYYVCAENPADLVDTAFRWVDAPEWYNDTYEARKNCTEETDGDLLKGRVNSANVYVCDFADTDKDSLAGWEIATDLEASIGGCRTRLQDSIAVFQGKSYYCYYGKWVAGSATEDDIYSWNDTVDGAWRRGFLHPENYYVFDESEGWRAATTEFDYVLGIDGCTHKRHQEWQNIFDEGDELINRYLCYNKKWYRNDKWSWDLPKDAYFNPEIAYDSIKDSRDGKVYRTVKIGEQVWMAENLNYGDSVTSPSLKGKSWCYENNNAYCNVTGRLYTWAAVIDSVQIYKESQQKCGYGKLCEFQGNVRGICPEGWHVPTSGEWQALDVETHDSRYLMPSQMGWQHTTEDSFGFSALPSGWGDSEGMFGQVGNAGWWWTATQKNADVAYEWILGSSKSHISTSYKMGAHALRCIKD
ncbi:MAG: hypothetical protein MJZ26_00860 [Fibrobacter sp.]|nr:hypothetical protein [Fibrobacter sp.]